MTKEIESEIIKIEEAVRIAQLGHDVPFLESVLADEFCFTTPQGGIITKQQDLDQYRSGNLKMKSVDISDRVISLFGATTAVVRFRVRFDGQAGQFAFSTKMQFTRIYSKHSGTWKMISGHSSEIRA